MKHLKILSAILCALIFSLGMPPAYAAGSQSTSAAETEAADTEGAGSTESEAAEETGRPESAVAETAGKPESTAAESQPGESGASESAQSDREAENENGGAAAPASSDPAIDTKSAILIDADSGTVLYEKNSHEELPPASVTKVMTMLLTMEAIDSGRISFDDEVTISDNSSGMGGSQLYMEPGETHTVSELLTGISMVSANDACVAMAEYISGTEEIFVEKMNEKAQELGLENTHFSNTNGLPAADHYSSAYDIALMSQELLSYPEILSYLSAESGTIEVGKEGHTSVIEMINTNKLLKTYNGATGIKTGFTQDAGYCLASSAERDDLRLIAVVLGAETSQLRFSESSRLLDYGFANYEAVKIADKNEIIGTAGVEKGFLNAVDIKTDEKIVLLVKKGEASAISYRVKPAENLKAPVNENDEAGTLEVTKDDETIGEYKLTASTDVRKADFKTLIIRSTEQILKG